MAPVTVELCNHTFVAKKDEIGGINIINTDVGIAYSGTEDGGRVVIARRNYSLNPEHKYDHKEPIVVHQGQDPVTKEVECKSIGGQNRTITVKITAF